MIYRWAIFFFFYKKLNEYSSYREKEDILESLKKKK